MSLTPSGARQVRLWVITACVIGGAALPFLIPGAMALPGFTDLEARIGFGAFAVFLHTLIGGVIGVGLAEFIVWVGGGARERRATKRRSPSEPRGPNDIEE